MLGAGFFNVDMATDCEEYTHYSEKASANIVLVGALNKEKRPSPNNA